MFRRQSRSPPGPSDGSPPLPPWQSPTAARIGETLTIAFVVVAVGFGAIVFTGWPVDLLAGTQQGALTAQSFAPDVAAVTPVISSDGVATIAMTLRAERYEPPLVDLQAGTPVRLSMQAIGDPG